MSIQAGDVVKLKSGSPPMTVSVAGQTKAVCVWYENGEVKTSQIEITALTKA
ncbi:YodC family protein [Acinetobacter proteolyticus]|uniref:YodC family protein n=1 Tax=Acinetobacter proteolyticus TaxID=1776741 RepID=UPI0009D71470|nr:DUF2158 domain-containing protein [Acinetobacter proteolyticus]